MLDIVRDYAAIGMGTAQAVTSRTVCAGRSGADWVSNALSPASVSMESAREVLDIRAGVTRGRSLVGGLSAVDVDGVITRLGLVKKSEVNAMRQQMLRLERMLGEVRWDR